MADAIDKESSPNENLEAGASAIAETEESTISAAAADVQAADVAASNKSTIEDEEKREETKIPIEEAAVDEPKKKRTAGRQITKDDGEDDDDDDDDEGLDRNAPFTKASEEVLASRRIVKVRRPEPLKGSVSSNPFAATSLTATKESNGATTEGTGSANVFGSGSGFSGFGATATKVVSGGFGAASSSGSGFGAFGSGGGGFSAFAAASTEAPKATGFGYSGLFGSSTTGTSSDGGGSGFTFGFAKPASSSLSSSKESGVPIVKLPDRVDLTTGEEDEENLHEVRCKSFKWARVEKPIKNATGGGETDSSTDDNPQHHRQAVNGAAAPSVRPSANFENKTSAEDGNTDGDGDTNKKYADDKPNSTSSGTTQTAATQFRWQELGIGPIKLLRHIDSSCYRLVQRRESTPNGNAHKVILNLPLWRETKVEKQSEKHLTLFTLTASGENERYMLKFKESYQALTTWNELQHRIPSAKSCFASAANSKTTTE